MLMLRPADVPTMVPSMQCHSRPLQGHGSVRACNRGKVPCDLAVPVVILKHPVQNMFAGEPACEHQHGSHSRTIEARRPRGLLRPIAGRLSTRASVVGVPDELRAQRRHFAPMQRRSKAEDAYWGSPISQNCYGFAPMLRDDELIESEIEMAFYATCLLRQLSNKLA